MNGENGRADLGREAGAAVDAGAGLLVQPVDAHECAARPADRRLRVTAIASPAETRVGLLDRGIRRDVLPGQAQLDPAPAAAVEAVGHLVRLGRGFE